VREKGLSALYNLAQITANKVTMWNDKSIQELLINAATVSCDQMEEVEVALQVPPTLPSSSACGSPMRDVVGASLIEADGADDLISQVQERAFGVLWSLSVAEQNKGTMWAQKPLQQVLLDGAASQVPALRAVALATLQNLAMDDSNKLVMWSKDAKEVFMDCIDPRSPSSIREMTLGLLISLSEADANRHSMWKEKRFQEALLATAASGSQFELRAKAISVLNNLAQAKANKGPLIQNSKAMAVLLDGSASTVPEDVRAKARAALHFLNKFHDW